MVVGLYIIFANFFVVEQDLAVVHPDMNYFVFGAIDEMIFFEKVPELGDGDVGVGAVICENLFGVNQLVDDIDLHWSVGRGEMSYVVSEIFLDFFVQIKKEFNYLKKKTLLKIEIGLEMETNKIGGNLFSLEKLGVKCLGKESL